MRRKEIQGRTIYKKVSFYIPCYNAADHIGRCLDSVLGQTYPIDEILVVDDGSTDCTVEIVTKYPVKIIRHKKNRGLGSVRNTAVKNAKNEFVAAIDADVTLTPTWLEKLMGHFDEEVAGAGGRLIEKFTKSLADRYRAIFMKQHGPYKGKTINPQYALAGSNCVYRKSVIEEVGYYDERYRTNNEDVDMYHRVRAKGYKLIYDPEAVAFHWCQDSIESLLKRAWNFGFADRLFLNNFKGFIRRTVLNVYDSFRSILRDVNIGEYNALIIDFLLVPYWTKFAWENYRRCSKSGRKP